MHITYKYRIKDGKKAVRKSLLLQARAVNLVWNYCCEVDREAHNRWKLGRRVHRPAAFDLIRLCRGVSQEIGLHSDAIDAVCSAFVSVRNRIFPKTPKFRSARKSLGWIPFTTFRSPPRINDAQIRWLRRTYSLWLDREIPPDAKIINYSINSDSRWRWYVNVVCEVSPQCPSGAGEIGIDLGIKDLAVLSDGTKIENPRYASKHARALARAQRARNKTRARSIHAKIRNARRHHLHEQSTIIVRKFSKIVVGNVSASTLSTSLSGGSTRDPGWSIFRNMLAYKAIRHGCDYVKVDERYTTVTCSSCGARCGPKGQRGLRIRTWECHECGSVHDRDTNSARNMLMSGAECRPPAEGIRNSRKAL